MTILTRRAAMTGALAAMGISAAGCNNSVGSAGAATVDARAASTMRYLSRNFPGTDQLLRRASGVLVMPLMTEAAVGAGGAYGHGALMVNEATVDYYSAAQATLGLQIGAQQYAHALFFMTNHALYQFRTSPGWELGGDIEYALPDRGGNLTATTLTSAAPVIGLIFGQAGLLAGASLKGIKYSRIIP